MTVLQNEGAQTLSLAGEWDFSLAGQSGTITVPGTWESAGYPHTVEGIAIYSKSLHIPAEWANQRVQIQFEAVSYHVQVYIDTMFVGEHTGLWTAFAFDITDHIEFGASNTIRLSIYKPGEIYPMRESLAGFLPDVSTTFGGVWGEARLVAFDGASFSDLWLTTNAQTGEISVRGKVHGARNGTLNIRVTAPDGSHCAEWSSAVDGEDFATTLNIPSPQYWQPDTPCLYRLECFVDTVDGQQARITRSFGFRRLACEDEQLLLNDQPVVLRGALNWGWYPEILCPAPDEATIRDEFRRVREFGYNMIKLCLYVPSPLYFQIADEEGMLLWLELPLWLPAVTPRMRQQARIEYADILEQVHHHPSIVIYSLGCELGHSVDGELLGELDALLRNCTSDVLACDNSGSGEAYGGLSFDYADFNDYHFYSDLHYFTPLLDHFRRDWRTARPWIFGEFCDADDYRDLAPITEKFGGELPWWFVEQNPIHAVTKLAYFEQTSRMAKLDLPFDDASIQAISRKQSFVIRKTILEKVRGRSGMGGYVVTGLRDTPLATSSMFDDLGRAKYPAEDFRAFNGDTVLVIEQGRARLWTNGGDRPDPMDLFNRIAGERIDLRLIVSHSGAHLSDIPLRWLATDSDGTQLDSGSITIESLAPSHKPQQLTSIAFTVAETLQARAITLSVELGDISRNHWTFWVYPAIKWGRNLAVYDPAGTLTGLDDLLDEAQRINSADEWQNLSGKILISSNLNDQVARYVREGGRAIILQTSAGDLPVKPCPFWREAIKLIHDHPALDGFPHEGYSDLQFYHLAGDHALDTSALQDALPDMTGISSIFTRLDARLFTVLDYLTEATLGEGKMLISTLHFTGNTGDQTTGLRTNNAGRYLLHQLLAYLAQ